MTATFVAGLRCVQLGGARNAHPAATQIVGGNMEGKGSALRQWAARRLAANVTSNGAPVLYTLDARQFSAAWCRCAVGQQCSFGEIGYGGLGSGLYSMIFVALVALVGGLMVGRTPEHLGKQIGPPEMKIIAVYTLVWGRSRC